MKIALHDNQLCLRGTTVAIYDYAFYLREFYGIECVILYNRTLSTNDNSVIEQKFSIFEVFGYENINEIDKILEEQKCDLFFAIKQGHMDGVVSNYCENLIMAISPNINYNSRHGQKYFVCSPWLSKVTGFDYVPHMINLPDCDENLRDQLGIPEDAIVFGRNGGFETFDIGFVKQVIIDIVNHKKNIFFIFQYTEEFYEHPQIIYLPGNFDLNFKVKFINTCDAHLHARKHGESFGLTCGEFSIKNKRVLTWGGSPERNHIDTLGSDGIIYNDYEDLYNLILNFNRNDDFKTNTYDDFLPRPVMDRFYEKYIKQND